LCSLGCLWVILLCSGAGSTRFGRNRGYMRADRRGQCGFANQAALLIAGWLCPYSDDVSCPRELAALLTQPSCHSIRWYSEKSLDRRAYYFTAAGAQRCASI